MGLVLLPGTDRVLTGSRDDVLAVLRSVQPSRVFLGETQTRLDRSLTESLVPTLRAIFPRFDLEKDMGKTEHRLNQALAFAAQILGLDQQYGDGQLRGRLAKLTSRALGFLRQPLLYTLCGGILGVAQNYLSWERTPGETPLLADEDGFFDSMVGAITSNVVRRDKLLNPDAYTSKVRFEFSNNMQGSISREDAGDIDDGWGPGVVDKRAYPIQIADAELEFLIIPIQTREFTSYTSPSITISNLLRSGLGLKRGTDYTRRFFRHLVELAREGSVMRLKGNGRHAGVRIFDIGGMPLESLFVLIGLTICHEVYGQEAQELAPEVYQRTRTVFHLLSMGARSAAELTILLFCLLNLPRGCLGSRPADFIVEFVQEVLRVVRLTFTIDEIRNAFWRGDTKFIRYHTHHGRPVPIRERIVFANVDTGKTVEQRLARAVCQIYSLRAGRASPFPMFSMPALPEHARARFELTSLISYLFLLPYSGMSSIDQAGTVALPKLPFNITSIAINEGTSKEVLSAILTELTQNSIDAIRTAGPGGAQAKGINIRIGFHVRPEDLPPAMRGKPPPPSDYYAEGSRTTDLFVSDVGDDTDTAPAPTAEFHRAGIVIEVSDAVGIPASALPALFVPYLSSKDPRDGQTTGEMGNGLFNVYREAELVTFRTHSSNGDAAAASTGPVRIFDIPVRAHGGRVTALQKVVQSLPNDGRAGTAITIFMPIRRGGYTSQLVQLQSYVQDQFTLFESTIPIFLNGVCINNNTNLFDPANVITSCVEFKMLQNDRTPSQVTTKGIPFRLLRDVPQGFEIPDWQLDILRHGVVMDLRHPLTCYSPVQSRTSVHLTDQTKVDLRDATMRACYVRTLLSATHELVAGGPRNAELNGYIRNFTVEDDYAQVLPRPPLEQRTPTLKESEHRFAKSVVPKCELLTYGKFGTLDPSIAELIYSTLRFLPVLQRENVQTTEYAQRLMQNIIDGSWTPWMIAHKARLAVNWVLNKKHRTIRAPGESPVAVKRPEWHNVNRVTLDTYKGIVDIMCQSYARVYFAAVQQNVSFPRNAFARLEVVCDPMEDSGAWYTVGTGVISINMAVLTRKDIDAYVQELMDPQTSAADVLDGWCGPDTKLPRRLFGWNGAIVHEFEHARRRTTHAQEDVEETHGSANFPGWGVCSYDKCMELGNILAQENAYTLNQAFLSAYRAAAGYTA
jgi:hypothetical protein